MTIKIMKTGCVFFFVASLIPYKAIAVVKSRLLALGKLLVLFCCCIGISYAENADKVNFYFDIPAQELSKSLHELSNQTEVLFLFPYGLVEQRQGNAVKGQMTLAQALKRLLQGSGLHSVPTSEGVMTISAKELFSNNRKGEEKMNTRKNILASTIAFFVGAGGASQVLGQESVSDMK